MDTFCSTNHRKSSIVVICEEVSLSNFWKQRNWTLKHLLTRRIRTRIILQLDRRETEINLLSTLKYFFFFFFLFPMMPHGVWGASTNSFHLPRSTASLILALSSLWNPSGVSEAHWFPLNLLLAPVWGISPTTGRPVESLTASGPNWFLSFWVNCHSQVYSVLRRRVVAFAPLSFSYWYL
jgi:hypothetical protein